MLVLMIDQAILQAALEGLAAQQAKLDEQIALVRGLLSGGKKLMPEQLEARSADLIPYPFFFTGMPDDTLGQCVVLVVEKEGFTAAEEEALNAALAGVLTKHERPKRIIALRSFKRTGSGKVLRALGG